MLYKIITLILFYTVYSKAPDTITTITIENYLGHWIQIYGAPTNMIFQGYGKCITADYGLLTDGNISVLNSQINEDNIIEEITGYGYYKNNSEPGKLTVHLEGVPRDSPYWIVKLGEVIKNEYQYSIITVPSGISLWVLARDINKFMESYDEEVRVYLDSYHFKYIPIIQENCNSGNNYYKYSVI
jgi:lipocalin